MSFFDRLFTSLESRFFKPRLSIWRTIYINLRVLSPRDAIRLPIKVYGKVKLPCLSGKIIISPNHNLLIGRNGAGYVNTNPGRICIMKGGVLKVGNNVRFAQGTNIFVGPDAHLEFGDSSTMGDNAKIICYRNIKIGSNCDLTWESQTTDFNSHFIKEVYSGEVYPICKSITIGDYCWIGNRTSVMPGTILPDRIIVASNSLLNKDYTDTIPSCSLMGGIPAKLIKTGVTRIYDRKIESQLMKQV